MLAKYSLIVVKTAETFNYRVSLKEECFCRLINVVALLVVELHSSVGNWNFILKFCNSQRNPVVGWGMLFVSSCD
jgi:hypothetical protein